MYVLFNPKNDTDKALRKINVIYFIINGGEKRLLTKEKLVWISQGGSYLVENLAVFLLTSVNT